MELEKAKTIAEELISLLNPVCNRIAIAGSIRRQKPDVGDIELLVIPRTNYLDKMINDLMMQDILGMRLNKRGSRTYGPKNKLMVHIPTGMAVDIFSSTEENWGMALFVRTGSKEWNIKAMSRFHELGMQGHAYGGVTLSNGVPFECPTEGIVFNLLGWLYTPPEKRGNVC
jgi:DNA polymerase (family X)